MPNSHSYLGTYLVKSYQLTCIRIYNKAKKKIEVTRHIFQREKKYDKYRVGEGGGGCVPTDVRKRNITSLKIKYLLPLLFQVFPLNINNMSTDDVSPKSRFGSIVKTGQDRKKNTKWSLDGGSSLLHLHYLHIYGGIRVFVVQESS